MQISFNFSKTKRAFQLSFIGSVFILCLQLASCSVPTRTSPTEVPAEGAAQVLQGIERFSKPQMSAAMRTLMASADQFIAQSQWTEAIALLERALRISPKQAQAWTRMALVYRGKGDYPQAIHMARRSNSHTRDKALQAYNWVLMSQVYQSLNEPVLAQQARDKSQQLGQGQP